MIPPRRSQINAGAVAAQRRRSKIVQALRLGGFWSKLRGPFRFVGTLLLPWLRARRSLRDLDRMSGPEAGMAGRGCIAVVAHYGDHAMADAFLDHHGRLGIKAFVLLDLSTDGGLAAHLGERPGCAVWRPRDPARVADAPTWLNGLRARYAENRWCLSLDSCDAFVFYRCETRTLGDFTDFLESESRDHAFALVVEMYGDQPAADLSVTLPASKPAALLDCFDAFGFVTLDPGRFRNVIVRGGLQRRLLHRTRPRQSPALNRIPLVKWQWYYAYQAGTRLITPAHLNNPHTPWHSSATACILRYALLASRDTLDRAARYEAVVTLKDGGHAAYPGLAHLRDTAPLQEASRRYRSSRDLVEAGLLNPGQWF